MNYCVITERNLVEFEKKVNEKMKEGYEVCGGVSTTVIPNAAPSIKIVYSQALLKN